MSRSPVPVIWRPRGSEPWRGVSDTPEKRSGICPA